MSEYKSIKKDLKELVGDRRREKEVPAGLGRLRN